MSALSKMEASPLHCYHYMNNGGEDTKQMKFGRHCHAYLLERDTFEFKVVEGDLRLKENKDLKKQYEDEGFEVLSKKDYDNMVGAVESVLSNEKIANWLKKAECEKPIRFEIDAIPCKALIDTLVADEETLIDFKFVEDANPQAFRYKALRVYKYHRQMAWYKNAAKKGLGVDIKHVYLIAVEKKAPYAYTIIKLSDDLLDEGKRLYEQLFEEYKKSVHIGNIYGYPETVWHTDNYTENEDIEDNLDMSLLTITPKFNLSDLSALANKQLPQISQPTVMADSTPPQIIEEPHIIEKRGKLGRKGKIKKTKNGFSVEIEDAFGNPFQWFSADTRKAANALLKKYL